MTPNKELIEEIKKILSSIGACGCVDDYTCVMCKAIHKVIDKALSKSTKQIEELEKQSLITLNGVKDIYLQEIKELKHQLQNKDKQIERLKNFGVWIDESDNIHLANDIYTEGGKNEEVHKATRELKHQLQEKEEYGKIQLKAVKSNREIIQVLDKKLQTQRGEILEEIEEEVNNTLNRDLTQQKVKEILEHLKQKNIVK